MWRSAPKRRCRASPIVSPLAAVALSLLFVASVPARAATQAAGNGPPPSLYGQGLRFQDENSASIELASLRGKSLLVTMAYTSCKQKCPMTIRKLKQVEEKIAPEKRPTEFVIVTLDPRADTPERLREYYRNQFHVSSPHWHFLRGDAETTAALARFLGIRFENLDEHISHDDRFVLIDADGRIGKSIEGWDSDVKEFEVPRSATGAAGP